MSDSLQRLYLECLPSRLQCEKSPHAGQIIHLPRIRNVGVRIYTLSSNSLFLRSMLTSTPSIAEVTTLILCGCLPVLPRLCQVFQHNTSHSPSNGRSFKMDRTQSDKRKSNPSNPSQSSTTTWVESAYVPLSGLSAVTISSRGADEDAVGHGGITRTVHIETQLQDNIC